MVKSTKSIALIGDYNPDVVAHVAIPTALELARKSCHADITWSWVETSTLYRKIEKKLADFSAIWVVPGSPYANMEGVLEAIRIARESHQPFLGTCGGYQHALIEYARSVCHLKNADHAETNPDGTTLIVTPLLCSLIEQKGQIFYRAGSRLHSIFGGEPVTEGYHCNYGLNPKWKEHLEAGGLNFTGFDSIGNARSFELPTHPFFIGTLFQPERSSLQGKTHPLIKAFVESIPS